MPEGPRGRAACRRVCLAGVCAAGLALLGLAAPTAGAQPRSPSQCEPPPEVPAAPAPEDPAALNAEGRELTLPLGSKREVDTRRVFLERRGGDLPEDGASLFTILGDVTTSDGRRLHPEAVTATSRVLGSRVEVRVCVDPTFPRSLAAGEYTGRVTIDDPRITDAEDEQATTVSVPLTIRARYAYPWLVWTLTLPAAVAATVLVWASHNPPAGFQSLRAAGRHCWRWVLSHAVNVIVAAAAGGAVIVTRFEADPTWGTSAVQFFEMAGAGIGAVVTMLTGGQAIAAHRHRTQVASEAPVSQPSATAR